MILAINPYLIGAIILIAALSATFFISYVLNKKTPIPEGCEDLVIDDENCMKCNNVDCSIRQNINFKKIEEEIKEEI